MIELEETTCRIGEAKGQATKGGEQDAATPLPPPPPPPPPPQKAALAKSEKALKAWLDVLPAIQHVAVRCGEEGKKPSQVPDFNVMFNEIDAVLTCTQMRRLRSGLPEGYVDREGGKSGKV